MEKLITYKDLKEGDPRTPSGRPVMSIDKKILADLIAKKLIADGRLIEAGFQGLRVMAIPDDAPNIQVTEMRMAFFAGAQHVWGTIMNVLDPGDDPTPADLIRMDKIDAELRDFIDEFSRQHGIES